MFNTIAITTIDGKVYNVTNSIKCTQKYNIFDAIALVCPWYTSEYVSFKVSIVASIKLSIQNNCE